MTREWRLHHEREGSRGEGDSGEGARPIRGQYSGHVISLDQSEEDRGDPDCLGCRMEQRDREESDASNNSGLDKNNHS